MHSSKVKEASPLMVIIAFTIVYLVWGSTYFFIHIAVQDIPPFLMGALRFFTAGLLMMGWCIYKKENLWEIKSFKPALVVAVLLLFMGNGSVIWAEQLLPSSLVAILISASPIWFVLLDKSKWKENFKSRETLAGLVIGFAGVILLFSEQARHSFSTSGSKLELFSLLVIVVGSLCWSGGSIYSKYNSGSSSATVSSTWQMLIGGMIFLIVSLAGGETKTFQLSTVSTGSWLALLYLIVMGSLAAYSAYVWLLQVQSATKVSTYAYVNPIVAVLLGVFFAGEKMSMTQITGLIIILGSVLLINLSKYRKKNPGLSAEPIQNLNIPTTKDQKTDLQKPLEKSIKDF